MEGSAGGTPGVWGAAWILGAVFLAGLLRGYTGFGFAIAAVPMLSLVLPPTAAVPVVLALQAVAGLGDLADPAVRQACHWRSFTGLAVGAALATPLGAWLLGAASADTGRIGIAAIVVAAAGVLTLRRGALARMPGVVPTLTAGFVSGLSNGFAGMPGPPVIAYYLAVPLEAAAARASMMVFFCVTGLLGVAATGGALDVPGSLWLTALLSLPSLWLGSWLGARAFAVAPSARYRGIAVASFFMLALLVLARAVWASTPGPTSP